MTAISTEPRANLSAVERAAELAVRFAERAPEHDRNASFPFENFQDLFEADLLNLTVSTALGGGGAGLFETCRVVQAVAYGDPSTALVLAMHYLAHAMQRTGGRDWPPDLYQAVVGESRSGVALINSARVEPELGTPARGGLPATTARRTSDGWAITGHKIYTTGSPILRYFVVWAKTDELEPRVGGFLVPSDSPGLRIEQTWDHLGMRASGSHDLLLDDVRVPERHALSLNEPGRITANPQSGIWSSLVISALYLGVARAARDWLVNYLNQRAPSNLGAPLATLPRFQSAVGEIEALLFPVEQLIASLAAASDAGETIAANVPGLARYTASTNIIRAAQIALELVGNPGLSRTNPLERHYRDVLCSRVHTPQPDSVLLAAGKAALTPRPS